MEYSATTLVPTVVVGSALFAVAVSLTRRNQRLDVARLTFSNANIAALIPRLPTLQGGYRPPLLHPTGLLQSRLADVPSAAPTPRYTRETFELAALDQQDGRSACCPAHVQRGVVSVDWLPQPATSAPICLLIPGLTGSSSSAYIERTALALHAAGLRVGCFNPRGRGGNELVSPFMYSAGYTEDLRRVVQRVRETYPGARLTAAGYSLGSSYLAKYVGEEGARCPLSAAALFACPTDLPNAIRLLGQTVANCTPHPNTTSARRALPHARVPKLLPNDNAEGGCGWVGPNEYPS